MITERPVLCAFRCGPYAMHARLALASSGLACELRKGTLRSNPAELLAASPSGTASVLTLPGGAVIDESLDVMRWTLLQCDLDRWLGVSQGLLDNMQALIAENDVYFKLHLNRSEYPTRDADEHSDNVPAFAAAQRAGMARTARQGKSMGTRWRKWDRAHAIGGLWPVAPQAAAFTS